MITEIQILLDSYHNWLRNKTMLRQIDEWVEITTPYLDRHNDYIQIYAKKNNGSFLLTDDGETITDLELSGCKLQSLKRQELLTLTLNGFGVQRSGDELHVIASKDNFALRKHNLVQAMLAVNDMFYLSESTIKSLFLEDLTNWLDSNDVRYISNLKFSGKSGYDHYFDFVIAKSRKQPERFIKAINSPDKKTASNLILEWMDTREVRSPDSKVFAFLNDSNSSISVNVIDALQIYEIKSLLWSKRNEYIDLLAA